ncbi:MAG: serine/threonine transporter SstT [Eubacterium sp.]|nr:serine/threonine transporter SstT [Eubacterium sp.]
MEKASFLKRLVKKYNDTSLILRIVIGIIAGIILALLVPGATWIVNLGNLFVGALKAVAPVLVFVLVSSALAQGTGKLDRKFAWVIFLYMISTFMAAIVAVVGSYTFPQTIVFADQVTDATPPQGIAEVLSNLVLNLVANPFDSLTNANYIGILFWAVLFGLAMKKAANAEGKKFMASVADGVSTIVRWIINLAPFGIMGLVFNTVSANGLEVFTKYGKLVLLLVGCMLTVALVVDPLIAFLTLRRNPYPLVFRCLRESGVTAFFTRSSAANIPVNMALCEKLGLDKDMYSVSIPLGATINMDGAAITITVMTLAAANTLGVRVDIPTAIILSILSTLGACGASGVAGGSLLLIPMACSLFGISNDIAMQVVGVGFIIGVIQDSVETMINSAGDVMFAATAEYHAWQKEGRRLPDFMYSKRELEKMKAQDAGK